ncbi:MAG: 5'-nucleotidase C-terminal domain-containing protein [Spirochaetaceae bacterium]|jgi:5'-nucleotidase/UDP-sugar diphosphatase|nr:5'-nucleotidase C-terminal domain-containing protein [Spirochaetaceae bacterium]
MRIKKVVFTALFAIAALSLVLGCGRVPKPPAREAGKTYELVLLHTNDHHGAVLPNNGLGGVAEVATFIKQVKAANAQVLLVDAGDINTGTALSNMFEAEPDLKAYNLMGYDVATFGNHEFDFPGRLEKQFEIADFPFVSSNIKTADGKFLGGHQYLIKDYDGFRVGIFGLTTLRTREIASPDKSLVFIPEIEAAAAAVKLLKEKAKADIIIGLTHIGDVKEDENHVTSLELAAAVPGIDIIVDAHSHSFFEAPKLVGGAYIVSANEWGKYVGQGRLSVRDGNLVGFEWRPVEIKDFAPDPEVSAMIAPYIERANASLKEVVGEAAEDFIFGNRLTRYQETAIGNMITDANVWYFRTVYNQNIDFAFHNGGNIRAALPKGKITQEQILTVLPFENYLYIVSLKGSQLLELFDFIATIQQGAGGFPQFSKEVRYTLDYTGGTGKVSGLTIGGAPVDPNKTYRFCTNDYLLGGGDGYTVLTGSENPFNTSLLLSYVVIEYIKAQGGVITPSTDGRLTVIGGVTP